MRYCRIRVWVRSSPGRIPAKKNPNDSQAGTRGAVCGLGQIEMQVDHLETGLAELFQMMLHLPEGLRADGLYFDDGDTATGIGSQIQVTR